MPEAKRSDDTELAGILARSEIARVDADLTVVHRVAGAYGALGYLNARTRFRFTGIYRANAACFRSLILYDRENPGLRATGTIRAGAHMASVPMHAPGGALWGLLCHHDLRPRLLRPRELLVIEFAAQWLASIIAAELEAPQSSIGQ